MKALLIVISLVATIGIQSQEVEDLKAQLATAKENEKAGLENSISEIYLARKKHKKAVSYADLAIAHAKSLSNATEELRGYINGGNASKKNKKYNEAIAYFEQAARQAQILRKDNLISYSYESTGFCFSELGNPEQSILQYNKALNSKRKPDKNTAAIYSKIAYNHFLLSDFKESIFNYEKANKLYNDWPDDPNHARMLINLGKVYANYGDYDTAISKLEKALKISKKNGLNSTIKEAEATIRGIEENQNNKDRQITDFDQDTKTEKEKYIDNIERANVKSLKEIENLSIENQVKELKLLNQQNRLELKERQAEAQKHALERQNFTIAKKEAELKQEKTEKAKKAAEAASSRAWLVAVGSASTLMLILVLMYVRNNRKLKDKNEQIASQNKELDKKNKDILDSIYYARKIQNALLVSNNCLADRFADHLIFNRPRDIVSGDFSWCDASSDDCIIALADCTGHGVPGAFMSVLAISSLDKIVKQLGARDPKTILKQLNDDLYGLFGVDSGKEGSGSQASVKDGMDIVVINVDTKNKKLGFAGSRNSLVKISGDELVEIKGSKAHLGQNYGHDEFNNQQVQLREGDALYLFSDGFYDQKGGEEGKKFYPKRFREMLLEHAAKDMNTQSDCYSEVFTEWSEGREQIDDILILGIRL